VLAELVLGFDAFAGDPDLDAAVADPAPQLGTCTIAVNTARASTGAVPPPCGRRSNTGINGSAGARSSSGINRRHA
jgi:hypothetical protein